ncbi:ComF family protein [Planctomycetota bacterium]|nr:ComF family protein [Planctomycetota bacterium]
MPQIIRIRKAFQLTGRLLLPNVMDLDAADYLDDIDWQPDPPENYCPHCGQTVGPYTALPKGCSDCHNKRLAWDRIIRLGSYDPPLDRRIKAFKYNRQWKWSAYFGQLIARSLPRTSKSYPAIITDVPLHRNRLYKRGYNQSALLAKQIARYHNIQYRPLVRRIVNTLPQSQLPPSKRRSNVSGAFQLIHPDLDLTNTQIILVDDIKTSGSTLKQCSTLLKQAGALTVTVTVIAVADPKSYDDPEEHNIRQAIEQALQ